MWNMDFELNVTMRPWHLNGINDFIILKFSFLIIPSVPKKIQHILACQNFHILMIWINKTTVQPKFTHSTHGSMSTYRKCKENLEESLRNSNNYQTKILFSSLCSLFLSSRYRIVFFLSEASLINSRRYIVFRFLWSFPFYPQDSSSYLVSS